MLLRAFLFATLCLPVVQDSKPSSSPVTDEIPWPYTLGKEAYTKGPSGYLNVVLAYREREKELTSDLLSGYYDFLGTYLTFLDEREELLKVETNFRASINNKRPIGTSTLDDMQPVNAVDAILSEAKSRQVVMFNEEHRSSIQRAFMARLLDGLYERGFRTLAVEAVLTADAPLLQKRGYPIRATGLYTNDPVFGDVLRRALQLGMRVIAYDRVSPRDPKDKSPLDSVNRRELSQAKSIFEQTLARDKNEKVIVYVGRHHFSERATEDGWKPMGVCFRELSGVDPLTVDLLVQEEREKPEDDAAICVDARKRGWLRDDAICLRDKTGALWSSGNSWDVSVFLPRTSVVNGRSHWRSWGGKKSVAIEIDCSQQKEPWLLAAVVEGESADATPSDLCVLWPDKPTPKLLVRTGKYVVTVVDRLGKEYLQKKVEVK